MYVAVHGTCMNMYIQVSEMEVSEYMAEVVGRLQAARRRGQRFLHQTSGTKVYMIVYTCTCTCTVHDISLQ